LNLGNEDEVFRSFAYSLFKDIQIYVAEHQSEYEEWVQGQKEGESAK
jgi:hypothetical protein